MIEIKKLQALKKQANHLLSKVDINNPVSSIAQNYVSRTGLTKSDISGFGAEYPPVLPGFA